MKALVAAFVLLVMLFWTCVLYAIVAYVEWRNSLPNRKDKAVFKKLNVYVGKKNTEKAEKSIVINILDISYCQDGWITMADGRSWDTQLDDDEFLSFLPPDLVL